MGVCRSSFQFTGAAASHFLVGDGAGKWATPLVLAAITLASWALRPAARRLAAPVGPLIGALGNGLFQFWFLSCCSFFPSFFCPRVHRLHDGLQDQEKVGRTFFIAV